MNIVRRLSDGLVEYVCKYPILLTTDRLAYVGFSSRSVGTSTHEVLNNIDLDSPTGFTLKGSGYNGGVWSIIDKTIKVTYLDQLKNEVKQLIKEKYDDLAEGVTADTTLGFSVEASHVDIINFSIGKEFHLPAVRASDDTMHPVQNSDYDIIDAAIKINGIRLKGIKWTHQATVDSLTTIKEVQMYDWRIGW
jgi:hypothetical protein